MPARKHAPIIGPRPVSGASRGKILRRCSKCDSGPGHLCGRWNGLGVWKPQKTFHRER